MKSRCSSPVSLPWTQYGHALQIPRQTNQRPFVLDVLQSAQQELAESHHRLDDAEHGFDGLLAQGIERQAGLRFQLVRHGRGFDVKRVWRW